MAGMPPSPPRRHLDVAICLLLAVAVVAAYEGVRSHDFVNYDDPDYVIENQTVRQGLTRGGVLWALGVSTVSMAAVYLLFRVVFQVVLPIGSLWQ